jgi:hypothetical protein
MSDKVIKKTKAQLYEMLAGRSATRNPSRSTRNPSRSATRNPSRSDRRKPTKIEEARDLLGSPQAGTTIAISPLSSSGHG